MNDSRPDPVKDPQESRGPADDAVRAQMGRTLSSAEFAQSDRLQRFLRFIVEETLAGRANALKEYTIALEVFERDESFDPQTSSIVRVEASRLRGKLKRYNAIDGRNDPVRIDLPPGSYVPKFETAGRPIEAAGRHPDAGASARPQWWGTRSLVALVAALILVAGTAALFRFGPPLLDPGRELPREASKPARSYSVAVLPLRNLSGDADQDYFSDGMTDALIAGLAKQDGVRVISLTSAMAYKNVSRPVADIARELNVDHVIEGAVLRSGGRVRITAQLIEVATDSHLWAESYERDVTNVLSIQDEVVRHIVASLFGQLAPAEDANPKDVPAIDPAAYEAQIKGRFFMNKTTEAGYANGIAYFKQAIARKPDYALAYSGMAACYCLLGGHGFEVVKPSEGMPTAKAAALEALRLDDTLAEPHALLGIIRLKYDWDWAGAEEAFKRSIQRNPSYPRARLFYSYYLEAMGRKVEAIREAEAARTLDPLSLAVNVNLGWQYLQAGRLERARQQFEDTAELNPDFWGVHWGLGHMRRRNGEYDQAISAFRRSVDAGGGHALPLGALGYTYAISGRPAAARETLDRLGALARQSYVSPFNMATVHVGLGEPNEAFAWLEKGFADRSRSMAWLGVAKEFDGLRSDPRFKSLLRRIGLPE